MKEGRADRAVVLSILVCGALVFVGLIRFLSYSQGAVGDFVRSSIFGFLCYDPAAASNVRYFKFLATPSAVALIYFLFRWRNTRTPRYPGAGARARFHRIDFGSPLLRAILTSVITLHWLAMEWWKFSTEGFYPWSPLESRWGNIAVLLAGQAFAWWAMRFLSFNPVRRSSSTSRDDDAR